MRGETDATTRLGTVLRHLGAFWRHSSQTTQPHAELTAGKHSDGNFNATKLIESPTVVEQIAQGLKEAMARQEAPTWVVGSPFGSITLAYELARQLTCCAGFTERTARGGHLALKRFELEPGARVLVVDDVITTGGTASDSIAAVAQTGGEIVDYVCAIVNRSGSPRLGERKIIALLEPTFSVWEPAACPLCQQGSLAIRPKGNWHLLTGTP